MIYSEEQVFMNTIIRIQVISDKGTVFTKNKIRKAFGNFSRVVDRFSRFSDYSELSILNSNSGKFFRVSQELFILITFILDLANISKGAFDPTIIDLLEAYGYDKKQTFDKLNKPEIYDEIKKMIKDRPSWQEIKLDRKNLSVKLAKGQKLDLGSVGKGYAIDLAYKDLKKEFDHFLINAGGDIRVSGLNDKGLYWKIMLYKAPLPNHAETGKDANSLGLIEMEPGKSIACSGGWARRVGAFHHLLSPFDGLPINENSQSYVVGPNAMQADAWATLLFVTGKSALPIMRSHELAGLLLDFQGNIFQSDNFYYSKI
jgi:thiamine biosynthesis lipoprotein